LRALEEKVNRLSSEKSAKAEDPPAGKAP